MVFELTTVRIMLLKSVVHYFSGKAVVSIIVKLHVCNGRNT